METNQESTPLEKVQQVFKFIIQDDPAEPKKIKHLIFEDGRHYKLQLPGFFVTYTEVWDTTTPQLSLLKLFLKNLFPENDKSPKIDEDYLSDNQDEAWKLWPILARGLL